MRQRVVRPDIYQYHDHRAYLKDFIAYLKDTDREFSMRVLAKSIKIHVGNLSKSLSGHRALPDVTLKRLIKYFKLQSSEASYLKHLRRMGEAKTPEEHAQALTKLQKYTGYQKKNPKEFETYKYLTHWFYLAIREMATLPGFKLDPEWIGQRLIKDVPPQQIKDAIEFLVDQGFITVDAKGKATAVGKSVAAIDGIFKFALRKFHGEMLDLAKDSIYNVPAEERFIMGHSMAIEEEKFFKVREIVDEAMRQLRELTTEPKQDSKVIHIELAIFPLIKKV